MNTADDSGPSRVGELLKHEDDLAKVADIRQKVLREKVAIDGQLKAGVQAQVNTLVEGLKQLGEAKARIEQVRQTMQRIHLLKTETQASVSNFGKINEVSLVLQKFDATQRFLDNFETMSSELDAILTLMDEDGDFMEDTQPMHNLLETHYRLSKLHDVKDDAFFLADSASQDVKRTITKHFAPLDEAIQRFDFTLFEMAGLLLEILRNGGPSLVVRIAHVIEYEEKRDLMAEAAAELQKSQPHMLSQNTYFRKFPRKYPSRFFKAIQQSVAGIYDACANEFPDNIEALLENLGWIFNDLQLVRLEMVKCVPKRWNIFERHVGFYHGELYKLLNKEIKKEPSAADILLILQFVKDYYDTMESQFQVPKKKLTPPLLDGKETELYDDYLKLIVTKLREWYGNFAKTEKEPFIMRTASPLYSEKTYLGMTGENDIFRLIYQQIEVAANSGQGRVLAGCIEECAKVLKERQQDWIKIMRQEVQKDISEVVGENGVSNVPPGLFDYLMALANDQIKAAGLTEAISAKRAPTLSKKYSARVVQQLDSVLDGFAIAAKATIGGMLDLVFHDVEPAFKQLFISSAWLKGKPMRQILDTLTEYMADSQQSQNPTVFEQFIGDLLDATILRYLAALRNGSHMLKGEKETDKAVIRIKEDVGMLYKLFTEPGVLEDEDVRRQTDVLSFLLATLEAPINQITVQFQALRQSYWDASLELFELMVKSRKGLDSKDVREIMVSVRAEALRESATDEMPPTLLSKFK